MSFAQPEPGELFRVVANHEPAGERRSQSTQGNLLCRAQADCVKSRIEWIPARRVTR